MLSLDEARALLLSRVAPLSSVALPLAKAFGLRLAESSRADVDLPPFDLAAMDGYAARAADLAKAVPLPVAFVVPAGVEPEPLPAGVAARIFTGAVVPAGADTVVPQEDAELLADGRVRLSPLPIGSHVRRRGEVFVAGALLAAPGQLLAPARGAVLAAGGAAGVRVFPRPRVALVITGAELIGSETVPASGQVRDSNGPMLAALASEAGLQVEVAQGVGDELPALCSSLADACDRSDLVVTSGGVSVGEFDLVPRAVAELGGETVLHRVAIQPGKPILVARVGRVWVIGLPGNPVSAFVGWRLFVRPTAETLAGDTRAFAEQPQTATLAAPARNPGDRTQIRPALTVNQATGLWATVPAWKGSHDIVSAAPANALARLERGADLPAGALVECFPLPWCAET